MTFTREIAPIVFARCVQCHHPEGSAPFALDTYASVRQHATQIATVTRTRLMPPWKAEPGYGDFIGQTPLTGAEIEAVQAWVAQGAIEGDAADLPPVPHWNDNAWQLGQPDLVVTLSQPYTLKAGGTDVFRNFVIPVPIDRLRYVRAIEFRPGNSAVVHHANILIDPTPTSRQLDDADPAPGYEGIVALSAAYPDGQFLAWTPGQIAPLLPPSLAWRLSPGADLVIETHMQPSGRVEIVQPSVAFYFGATPPERTPYMLRLSRQNIDIAPGDAHYVISDSYVLPVDVEVEAVQPHAHYRAREIKGTAILPDGTRRWLIYITDWDFRWQHVYRYASPFALPRGSTVTMEYTYDNSADNPRNPRQPPERAAWGQRTADEMGDLWIQVLTRDDRDRARLNHEFQLKAIAEDVVGYESLVHLDPGQSRLHDDLAQLYLMLGQPAQAVTHFTAALALKSTSAAAHFNLGTALSAGGRLDAAIAEYQRALQLDPSYVLAHNNLGNALVALGRLDEAIDQYRAAVGANPQNVEAQSNLGHVLAERGHAAEAMTHLQAAIASDPNFYVAQYNIAHLLRDQGRTAEAVTRFRETLRLRPDWPPALIDLAWLLATTADETIRDPEEAVRLAEQAVASTDRRAAGALDTLAAAYAACGQFERALAADEAALALDPAEPAAAAIRQRVALYRSRTAFRERVLVR